MSNHPPEYLHRSTRELLQYLERSREDGRSNHDLKKAIGFVPVSKVTKYFENYEQIHRLLADIFHPDPPPLALEIIFQKYARVLCILVRINEIRCIESFTGYEHLCDEKLPFLNWPSNFPVSTKDESEIFNKFYQAQWEFCARTFTRHHDAKVPEDQILPFLECRPLTDGGSSTINRIWIHQDYDRLQQDEESPSRLRSNSYALKTYNNKTVNAALHYGRETRAFMRLRSGEPNEHAQIVEFFAGFTHGGTYNVILEFAEPGTLEDYFQTTMPPRDEMNITSFWRNFLLALSATVSMVHENGGYHGWHGDMKPTNILVFNVENMRAYQSHTFKLADFGLSHFATAVSRGSISRVETSDTWGSAEYAAPETIQTDGSWEQIDTHLAQPADIWSLGCIASEAVTWLVNGIDGLEKYRAQRRNETDGISGLHGRPSFHNGRRKLKIVKDHHRELSNESSRSNQLTLEILRGPIRNMLNSSPPQRPSAQTLYLEIKGIIEKATAGISEPGPSRPSMSISAPGPSLPLMSIEDAAEKVFRGRTKLGKLDDGGMLDKLDKRDHVLLLDNAKTMSQHWPAVQSLTKLLLEITKDYDPNGIDIYFTIHGRHGKFKQINSVDKLNRIQPMRDMRSAPSRLGSVLENILVDYGKRLQSRRPGIFGGNPRPMSIYILTDGLWQDDAARAIRVMARTIDERRVNSDQVGLQFIRFGDEPSGIEKLKNLDDDLGTDPDIVDTTPATQEIYGRFC